MLIFYGVQDKLTQQSPNILYKWNVLATHPSELLLPLTRLERNIFLASRVVTHNTCQSAELSGCYRRCSSPLYIVLSVYSQIVIGVHTEVTADYKNEFYTIEIGLECYLSSWSKNITQMLTCVTGPVQSSPAIRPKQRHFWNLFFFFSLPTRPPSKWNPCGKHFTGKTGQKNLFVLRLKTAPPVAMDHEAKLQSAYCTLRKEKPKHKGILPTP